jgi:hypothetical protein
LGHVIGLPAAARAPPSERVSYYRLDVIAVTQHTKKYQYHRAAAILVSGKPNLDLGDHAPGRCSGRSVVPVVAPIIAVIPPMMLVHHDFANPRVTAVQPVVVTAVEVIDDHGAIGSALPVLPVIGSHPFDHNHAGDMAFCYDDPTPRPILMSVITGGLVSYDHVSSHWAAAHCDLR